MKYIILLSAFVLTSCSSMCPGVLCAVPSSSSSVAPELAKPVALPPVHLDPANIQAVLPAFQASWGLKKALYDKMQVYYAGYSKTLHYVAIADMSQHSSKRRLYIFDLETQKVEMHNVAHGAGSDKDANGMLEAFSNVSGSNATSEGMYKTAETYTGKHGLSLKLDGLQVTNSNARARAVVMHQADYVKDGSNAGRSWGCPAIDPAIYIDVINRLKGGSLLLIGN